MDTDEEVSLLPISEVGSLLQPNEDVGRSSHIDLDLRVCLLNILASQECYRQIDILLLTSEGTGSRIMSAVTSIDHDRIRLLLR